MRSYQVLVCKTREITLRGRVVVIAGLPAFAVGHYQAESWEDAFRMAAADYSISAGEVFGCGIVSIIG